MDSLLHEALLQAISASAAAPAAPATDFTLAAQHVASAAFVVVTRLEWDGDFKGVLHADFCGGPIHRCRGLAVDKLRLGDEANSIERGRRPAAAVFGKLPLCKQDPRPRRQLVGLNQGSNSHPVSTWRRRNHHRGCSVNHRA